MGRSRSGIPGWRTVFVTHWHGLYGLHIGLDLDTLVYSCSDGRSGE